MSNAALVTIYGLGAIPTTIKGEPFHRLVQDDPNSPIRKEQPTLGEWLFYLALQAPSDAAMDEKVKFRKFKLAERIAGAAFSVELSQEEIDQLKQAAGTGSHSIEFFGRICRILDEGGCCGLIALEPSDPDK